MSGSLPDQSQKMNSSKPELNDNWSKVSCKRGTPTQEGTEREAKHAKESATEYSSTRHPSPFPPFAECIITDCK
jgi:hypothetical protein